MLPTVMVDNVQFQEMNFTRLMGMYLDQPGLIMLDVYLHVRLVYSE